ncbi:MAG: amidohydrolase family protein [Eubacterium aggregans]
MYREYPITDYGDYLIIPGLTGLHVHAPQYPFRALGMDLELLPWLQTYTFPEESKYRDMDYAKPMYEKFVSDLKRSATTRAVIYGTLHTSATLALMDLLEESGLVSLVRKVNIDRNSIPELTEETGVSELHPDTSCYGEAYAKYGLFGGTVPTVMAHCVHSTDEEQDRIQEQGVFIAHCPQSNMNLSSGVAQVRRFLDRGISVGLGSDVAGGTALSIFRAMADAIQASKMHWALLDDSMAPLTLAEAFYLGTAGGGAFFGKVGRFEPGYAFDALVIDDSDFETTADYNGLIQRLERLVYLGRDDQIVAKYVCGKPVFLRG